MHALQNTPEEMQDTTDYKTQQINPFNANISPGVSGRHSANADQMPTYTRLRSSLLYRPR